MAIAQITTELISQFVAEIEQEYRDTLGLILSECDLQCLLYAKIMAYLSERGLARIETSSPGVFASPLHTEIAFLNEERKLRIQPDITLLDVRDIQLTGTDPEQILLRKGFAFYGSCFAIELKFCKSPQGIDSAFSSAVRMDCEKLDQLNNRLYPPGETPRMRGCVVVFNRTNLTCNDFQTLLSERAASNTSKVIYATASPNEASA